MGERRKGRDLDKRGRRCALDRNRWRSFSIPQSPSDTLEPATGGDAFSSIGLQSLVYAVVGVYFLIPALAHILSYLTMNGYALSGEWRAWSTQLFQAVLALALILGARRFASTWSV
jgi:hypothetical protein